MPEYKGECVMCEGSFSATADSLEELVKLIQCHIDEMERHHEGHHKGKIPHTKDEILASRWFSWTIFDLRPLNRLAQITPSVIGLSTASRRKLRQRRRREALTIPARS